MKIFQVILLSTCVLDLTGFGMMFVECSQAAGIDPATIVGVWSLDDSKGGVVKDSSKNGYDGQVRGTKEDEGKFGKALNFVKGDTVTINLGKGTIRDKVSIILWLKFNDITDQQNYFSIWDQSDHRYVPYKTSANELHFWSNNWDVPSGVFVSAKTWCHVANIYDGKEVKIYVNGELKVSWSASGFSLTDQQQTAWLATDKGVGFLSACTVDDVGLFNEALTENDVKNIMKDGIARALGFVAVGSTGKLPAVWGTLKN